MRAIGLIDAQISAQLEGERDIEWRHRRRADFVARAGMLLDAIEKAMLAVDAAGALRLVEWFYDAETEIVNASFDEDWGLAQLFEQATRVFHAAAMAWRLTVAYCTCVAVQAALEGQMADHDPEFVRCLRSGVADSVGRQVERLYALVGRLGGTPSRSPIK